MYINITDQNHIIVYLNSVPIVVSEINSVKRSQNNKLKWLKSHEKDRLITFIWNYYSNYYKFIKDNIE